MSKRSEPDEVAEMLAQWRAAMPDVDTSPLAVFGRLHRSFDRYQRQLTRVFARHGITVADFGILAALRRGGAPYRRTAGDLADTNLLTTGGITQRVDKLVQAGLVRRERDEGDRRVVFIGLTEQGLAATDKIVHEHFPNENRMLAGLTAAERTQLAKLLGRLERSLDQAESAG